MIARWPALPLESWRDTRETLHRWTQIVGKIRLALTPPVNHWWHVPLYVGARGLGTGPIPAQGGAFEMTFDFLEHALRFATSDGARREVPLSARSVASFHRDVTRTLADLGIAVHIAPMPVEIPEDKTPLDLDERHASYDPAAAQRFWRVLLDTTLVLEAFRGRFVGKASRTHFFWGSFDLALTFFSGRPAPERPGADAITREAYSQEVVSFGFWPGGGAFDASFYAYAAPEPGGFPSAQVGPPAARYDDVLKEFLLDYGAARAGGDPDRALFEFLESTYDAAATLGGWDRAALDRPGWRAPR